MSICWIILILIFGLSEPSFGSSPPPNAMSNPKQQKATAIRSVDQNRINGKTYLVPEFNMFHCEQYMLPKLDNEPAHHTFFNPKEINKLYEEKKIDPEKLDCNLDYDFEKELEEVNGGNFNRKESEDISELEKHMPENLPEPTKSEQQREKQARRPKLREKGATHFIHVPLVEQVGDTFTGQIKPKIEEANLDSDVLVDVDSLHATLLVFRMRDYEKDLPKWTRIVESLAPQLKKAKSYIKGVDIFPVKKKYTKVVYLNINGLDDLIDSIVSKAILEELISEKELQNVYYVKQSQMFKAEKQHVTILKTKGEDLIDGEPYIKMFDRLNLGRVPIKEVRMSMIGSFGWNVAEEEGSQKVSKEYYDEIVVSSNQG